ncbi:MAG: aminopeptidase N [Aliidongia sp.]
MLDALRDQTAPKITRLADYQPPEFLIESVDLVFELGEDETSVKSHLTVRRNPSASERTGTLILDGDALTLESIALDGEALGPNRFQRTATALTLTELPDTFTLDIETRIKPQNNTELSGLYKSGGNFCTQCEAEGFRRITFFQDRPDVMARYSTTILADKARYPVLLSNGNPVDGGDSTHGRHWAKWQDPHPKPAYLFALVAGDLVAFRDRFTTCSGREVALAIYVRRGDEDKCAHAMASLKASMRWDEEVYGREYDLDVFNIVAVSDFNMGAMENKGLNIFNAKYVLAKPETATDTDFQDIEAVIAHEYFHNWTGNRVTCRDWFQLSLKEGLTVFRDQEFSADQNSRAVARIGDVRKLRARQFPEDDGPLAHPVRPESYIEIDNFYTPTVYEKGAEVVRMIHTLLGAERFRKGTDLYFARHDNAAVTIEDFVQAMQDASGVDLGQFKRWYGQAGTPSVTVSDHYDPASRRYTLTVAQETPATPGQPVKQPFVIPLAMGLLDPAGAELPTRMIGETAPMTGTRILKITEATQSFDFEDVPTAPIPSLFRDFSAPVKLAGLTLDRLKFLAAHDPDPFARWEAGQQAATRLLLDLVAAHQAGQPLTIDPDLIESFRRSLTGPITYPAFVAETLTLPGEAFLADQMTVIDVEAIEAARNFLRVGIARALGRELVETYERLTETTPYQPTALDIGKRALRNTCLAYLAAEGGPDGIARAKTQFDAGQNMTDVLAALMVLGEIDCPERDAAFASFYQTWRKDELVIDKWFMMQAISSLPDTLDRCRALLNHPDFDRKNPNRVRALIGAFSRENLLRFHARSGAGYVFLADQVIAIDAANGNLAARLVQPLGNWRRQDAARRALMKRELRRVLAVSGLSKGTFEMTSKSLEES